MESILEVSRQTILHANLTTDVLRHRPAFVIRLSSATTGCHEVGITMPIPQRLDAERSRARSHPAWLFLAAKHRPVCPWLPTSNHTDSLVLTVTESWMLGWEGPLSDTTIHFLLFCQQGDSHFHIRTEWSEKPA